MEFIIEKGIPIPPSRYGTGRPKKYPFPDMKAGDSVFVPQGNLKRASIPSAISSYSKRHPGFRFTHRREGDGLRIWCIESPNGKSE